MAEANDCDVLPVLVDGAVMPPRAELDGIEWLTGLQALDLRARDSDFRVDAPRIIERIRELASSRREPPHPRWRVLAGVGALALVVVVVALLFGLTQCGGDDDDSGTTTAGGATTPTTHGSSEASTVTTVANDRLAPYDTLSEGEERRSSDGHHVLTMRDGLLQLLTDGVAVWTTKDDGAFAQTRFVPGSYAEMQGDGNLVVHPPNSADAPDPLWNMRTADHPSAYLVVREAEDGSGYIAVLDVGEEEVGRRPATAGTKPTAHPTEPPMTTSPPTDGSPTLPCTVPNLAGQTEASARSTLEADPCHAAVTTARGPSPDVAIGLVIGTTPTAGEQVPGGSSITLHVSDGTVIVCDAAGLTESQARAACPGLSISAVTQNLPAGDPRSGRVVAQSLTPSKRVTQGSSLTITIGRAAAATTTTK